MRWRRVQPDSATPTTRRSTAPSTTVGTRLDVRCSGCPQGMTASVSYVSQEPEFTPPVIYSAQTRQKLVYLVEARPEGGPATRLQPGQIVDVMLRGRK